MSTAPGSIRCWSCRPSITAISSTASVSDHPGSLLLGDPLGHVEPHVAVTGDEAVVTWMVDVDALGGQHGEQADELGPRLVAADELDQRVREPGALEHPLDALQVLLLPQVEHPEQQLDLGWEVVQQTLPGHPHGVGDRVERRSAESLGRKGFHRGLQDALALRAAARGLRGANPSHPQKGNPF